MFNINIIMFYNLPSDLITYIYTFDSTYKEFYNNVINEINMFYFYRKKIQIFKTKLLYIYTYINLYNPYDFKRIIKLNRKIVNSEMLICSSIDTCDILDYYIQIYNLYGKWVIELYMIVSYSY